jgi:DNA-binding transcriptional ArsR family regulator
LWLDHYINSESSHSELNYLGSITEEFPVTNEELSLFFAADEVKGSFFINKYFNEYIDKSAADFDFDFLMREILDIRSFAQKLLDFYLPDSNLKADWEDKGFLTGLIDLLSESLYTEKTKNSLISFFISPERYINPLTKELNEKNIMLNRFYQKNYKKIIDAQESFDYNDFVDKLKLIDNEGADLCMSDMVYVSVCLVAKNTIASFFSTDTRLHIIGHDYAAGIEERLAGKSRFEVDLFGKIISDKNRIEVISMLTVTPELSTSDIAKNLGISINAAYYHLDMMSQANMLSIRNEGRTVFYRLNRSYINKALDSVESIFLKK